MRWLFVGRREALAVKFMLVRWRWGPVPERPSGEGQGSRGSPNSWASVGRACTSQSSRERGDAGAHPHPAGLVIDLPTHL